MLIPKYLSRSMQLTSAVLFGGCFLVISPYGHGDQSPIETEAAKAKRVARVLKTNKLELLSDSDKQPPRVCEELMTALRDGSEDVQFIEARLRTDNPNHKAFAKYRSCERRDSESRGPEVFPGLSHIGHHRFRLYRLEMDGNLNNGPEEYLYGEWKDWNKAASGPGGHPNPPGYRSVDLDRCITRDVVSVNQNLSDRSPGNYNALIKYRSQFYIFDLQRTGTGDPDASTGRSYYMQFWKYEPKDQEFSRAAICRAATKHK